MIPTDRNIKIQEAGYPLRGVDLWNPGWAIDPSVASNMSNVLSKDGLVVPRMGYADYADEQSGETFIGCFSFTQRNGTEQIIAVSTTTVYNISSGSWSDLDTGTAMDWDGDEDNYLSWARVQDDANDILFFTNGKNDNSVFKSTDMGAIAAASIDPITNFKTCRAMESYYNRLVIGNLTTNDGGSPATIAYYPNAIAWHALGDATDWTGYQAGLVELPDLDGGIWCLKRIQGSLAIYSERSIALMTYLGNANNLFSFRTLCQDTWLISGRCVVNIGNVHLLMTHDGFFAFSGSGTLIPIGLGVSQDLRDNFDSSYSERAFGFHYPGLRRVYWILPTGANTHVLYILSYTNPNDPNSYIWAKGSYSSRPYGMGLIDKYPGLCHSAWIHTLSEANDQDDGSNFTASWETKDFTDLELSQTIENRWLKVEVELLGENYTGTSYTSVDLYYSVDEGSSWTQIQSAQTLTASWAVYSFRFDKSSAKIRFRVRRTGAGRFWIRRLRVFYSQGGTVE